MYQLKWMLDEIGWLREFVNSRSRGHSFMHKMRPILVVLPFSAIELSSQIC